MDKKEIDYYYKECHSDYEIAWELQKHYGFHYGYCDNKNQKHGETVANMNRVLAEKAGIRAGDNVCDCGCGIGGSGIWLAQNKKANTTGVNVSPFHLDIARALVKKLGLEKQVAFIEADYTQTNLPSGSFNVVWAIESVCYAEDKRKFIAEAFRLLKTNGCLIMADGFKCRESLDAKSQKIFNRMNKGWRVPDLATMDGFKKALQEQGFVDVRMEDETPYVLRSSKRLFWCGVLTYPLEIIQRLFGLRKDIHVENTVTAIYQYIALKKNIWKYCHFRAIKP